MEPGSCGKSPVEYLVDAGHGPSVALGEKIIRGQEIGRDGEGRVISSEVDGTVSLIRFEGRDHQFRVSVTQAPPAGTASAPLEKT
jgi:hypothetical protein